MTELAVWSLVDFAGAAKLVSLEKVLELTIRTELEMGLTCQLD